MNHSSSLTSPVYPEFSRHSAFSCGPFEDQPEARPPEKLLQAIWFHQRLLRQRLRTTSGQPFVVLHPGIWNHEPGPDFRGAVIQFAGLGPVTGDIEIDLESSGWRGHRHDINPDFRNVILHGVWQWTENSGSPHATLNMSEFLDTPIQALSRWLASDAALRFPKDLTGQCYAPMRELSEAAFGELLREAAQARLESKAAQIAARAREAGWDQAFWEGVFQVLGYKQNVWPMRRLGELRSRLAELGDSHQPTAWLARLLGVGGLLPLDVKDPRTLRREYVRSLWDRWWRDRGGLTEYCLPEKLWCHHGFRPANHPHRRLALVSHWLAAGDFPRSIERWAIHPVPKPQLMKTLWELLQVKPDEFWRWHWTLHSKRQARPLALLGQPRLIDLAVNLILPWLWSRAQETRNDRLREEMEARYFSLPASEDNVVLRLARARLYHPRHGIPGAARQQAFLQILKNFCAHSNAVCDQCQFPELVRRWPGEDPPIA